MSWFARTYASALNKSYYATHSVTVGTLYLTGDILAQRLERMLNVQSVGKTEYNYPRTARMFIFGFVVAGPVMGTWYPLLHRMTSIFRYEYVAMQSSSGASWLSAMGKVYQRQSLISFTDKNKEVVSKTIIDQILFMGPWLHTYLMCAGLLEGQDFLSAFDACRSNFHAAWFYCVMFWCPAQYVNFHLVPVQHHALVVNTLNVFWSAFLSLLYHYRDYGTASTRSEAQLTTRHADHGTAGDTSMVGQLSSYGGMMLRRIHEVGATVAVTVGDLHARSGSALSAARADWNRTAPTYTLAAMQLSEFNRLQDELPRLEKEIREQQTRMDLMERTIAAQAVHIQSLQESAAVVTSSKSE